MNGQGRVVSPIFIKINTDKLYKFLLLILSYSLTFIYMSKISQRQQMNVPIRTRNNEQVQTDVNLIGSRRIIQDTETRIMQHDSRFLQFTNQSWMLPFSDYYLLNQLNTVIQQLKSNVPTGEEYKTRKVIDQLAGKIHGLLARELKVTSKSGSYYDILLQKEKEITKLQIKYGNFEKKIDGYMRKIQQLEREISSLRNTLKNYQNTAEENQIYKSFFRQVKQITVSSKKVTDFERILNEQILPKIKQYEINLAQVSKNAGRERSSKQKAAISRYALELDNLSKSKEVSWETLSSSAGSFFSSIEHLNGDDWVQQRLSLAQSYNQLRTRHTALLSLVSKNVDELLKKDSAFKNVSEIAQFIRALQNQNKQGLEAMIVNGWIGLGVIHCHNQHTDTETLHRLRSLILLFQTEITKLSDRYPQLNEAMSAQLRQFLSYKVSGQLGRNDSLDWLKQILVRQTEVIHVDNVYNYYSKSDKDSIYYLRVLVKALTEQLKRINNDHKIGIELDEGILQLLKAQALDGVNIDDIIALFRPSARVCEVGVIVEKPTYIHNTQTVGVPLKQQKALIVADTSHFAVNLQQGVPYRKEIPYEYSKSEVVQVPVTVQRPYAVPTKVTQEVVRYDQKVNVVKVPVEQDKYIEVIKEVIVNAPEQILATEQIERQIKVPYHTSQIETRQVIVQKEVPKNIYKEISKIFKVEQTVPKVYKQPKFEIVQRPVHHVVIQKQIEFVEIEKPIIQRHEVAKITEIMVEKPIYYPEHCDCQKPEAVVVEVQKPIYKQYPKEIIVQRCHFIQPNVQERIVEIACHTQVPIFRQIIREEPVFIEKIIPFRTIQEKLVVVDRQIPFFIEHFTPIELIVEKPVIVRDIKHIPVQVQQPVPVYIEKIVPKIVQVFRDKIVEKIVQVPRVEIVERIVERIVTIPRIVERIVPVTQIVEVPVFIETPILEVIQIPVERLVIDIQERQKIIEVKTEVLAIEKSFEVVEKIDYQQVRKVVEVEPESYPQIIVEKLIRVIEQRPVEIYIDRIVDRVIHIKDIVPVEQRVEIPIQVQMPVQIITQKPIFYKQPIVQIDVQRVQREKIVELEHETIQIKQIPAPYIQRQKQVVELPGQTIILKEPELHIIQIEKENVITATDVEDRPVQHYMDMQRAQIVDQQTYVVPEKQVCYLEKPYAVSIQRPVQMKSQQMVVVQRPDTMLVKTREGLQEQVIKVITQQKLVAQRQSYPQPIPVPEHHYHVVYQQLPPKAYERSVLAIDQKVKTQQVTNTIQVQGTNRQVITKQIEVPVYMQKIFEKILMLPQIVQVEKKVYMVEEINSLIAKEISLETHYDEYKGLMNNVQAAANDLLILINSGKQGNTADFKKKLNLFIDLLKTESRIPKIVQNVRQVEVVRERDRPVLVPVYDSERQKVLHCIISDLVQGIKGLSQVELEKRFPERVRNLFAFQFGFGGIQGQIMTQIIQQGQGGQLQNKWKSWLSNYDRSLPSTRPQVPLSEAERLFIIGYDSKDMDYATIKASLQKLTLIHKQRLHQIERLKGEYSNVMSDLRTKIDSLEGSLSTQKYYKDLYYSELIKIKRLLQQRQYDQILIIIQRITSIREETITSRITTISERGDQIRVGGRHGFSEEDQAKLADLLSQLSVYQSDVAERNRQIHNLKLQNDRLRFEIDQIKLNVPSESRQMSQQYLTRFNEWKQKIQTMEQNHFLELNHLREQLIKRLTDGSSGSSDQFAKNYEELMRKYQQQSQNHLASQNTKRNLINSYEDKVKDLNKQLITIRREFETLQGKNESERKRLIDDYERRLTSTSSTQEKQLRRQLETIRRNYENLEQRTEAERKRLVDDYEKRMSLTANNQQRQLRRQLDQAKRNLELAEQKLQSEKKRITDQYETKSKLSAGNQERQLRRQIDTLKRNNQVAEQKFESEKRRIVDDYERKISTSASNQQRDLRRQLDQLRRNYEILENNSQNEKRKLVDQYEAKLRSTGSSQERQLKRELDTIKKNFENYQKNTESQKVKNIEDYERRLKQAQQELQRAKTVRRSGIVSSPEQVEQLQLLKDKIKKLQIELDSSKKEVESYQKSRLGQTTYTSGIKQSVLQTEFQSPQTGRYRSGGHKFEQVVQGSSLSKQQQEHSSQIYQRSTQTQKGRVSKSGVRPLGGERSKLEQGQQVRSSSSRVSGGSESSVFKSSMTMKQFMDLKKADDKDSIITLVMIKVIEKIQEQAEKGIINSYNPSNIYLSNFNPSNLDSLVVRFGAPITNRKSKIDGLYLAPEVLRGEGTSLKSVVFTLAVIWDELIHYEIYYKKVEDIENLAYEYKVRDTSLNPILRNTLFEMMSKDASKRLELGEAKRRLSLQRYIVSQGRAGTTTSRVSTQSRKV